MKHLKRSLLAIVGVVATILSLGFGTASAFADDGYGATVTATGNTVAFTIPAGTYDPGSDITLTWTDPNIDTILKAGSVTYQADENGAFSGKVVYKSAVTEVTTIVVKGVKDGKEVVYTIKVDPPSTGTGTTTEASTTSTGATTANTGATVVPIVVGVVLLVIAGVAILSLRKKTTR
ncbi:MAG: hypothetical protein LKF35_03390 [Bifidobacterium minimum]|jgi:hypothetical protein|nr:hypothetical protein [Bifidobacterium minimum]